MLQFLKTLSQSATVCSLAMSIQFLPKRLHKCGQVLVRLIQKRQPVTYRLCHIDYVDAPPQCVLVFQIFFHRLDFGRT